MAPAKIAVVKLIYLVMICPGLNGKQLLNLGLVTPPDGKLGYPSVAAASTWAVSDAQEQEILRDFDIR